MNNTEKMEWYENILSNLLECGTLDVGFLANLLETSQVEFYDVWEQLKFEFSDDLKTALSFNLIIAEIYKQVIDTAIEQAGITNDDEKYEIQNGFEIDTNFYASSVTATQELQEKYPKIVEYVEYHS